MAYNSTDDYLKIIDDLVDLDIDAARNIIPMLLDYVRSIYRSNLENEYSAPMLYIGMYIASASLVCILAMVADLLHGLHRRKLWFPCKYFKINAAFLTIIGIAMKLPVDLSGSMPGNVDQAGKLGSMAFMCTMMANLLPCLASMDDNQLLSNISALCILVITMVVNVIIQIQTGVVSYSEHDRILDYISPKHDNKSLTITKQRNIIQAAIYVTLLLVLLMAHVCSCLAILRSKKIIESKYKQCHDQALKDFEQPPGELSMVDRLQKHVTNHWIMAGSGSPQFIAACFRTTSASGVTCLLVTVSHTLTMSWTFKDIFDKNSCQSDYAWSMIVILIVQHIGVVVGTIAPLSRCFATLSFKVSREIILNHFKVFEVENHWTHKLHEWKRASINLSFGSHKLKVVADTLKRLILSICIELQEGVVVVSNITALFPFVFMICVWYCYQRLKWLKPVLIRSSEERSTDDQGNTNKKDLDLYVLHLENKMELAERTLEELYKSVNRLIKKGENRPDNLKRFIDDNYTTGYSGVGKFDQIHPESYVPSLRSIVVSLKPKEIKVHPESWSLPVVTLTAIVVSLKPKEIRSLLKSVRDGIKYVTCVEESLNVGAEYVSIQKEAKNLWNEVDLHKRWLGHKLKGSSFEKKTGGEIVKWFRDTAKNIEKSDEGRYENVHLQYKYICANSMYHITKTIMLTYQNIDEVSKEDLFVHLSSMIADIIAACLTNLPQAIKNKCHTDAIEKRVASVKVAARLLVETKKIMETLETRKANTPAMDSSDLPFIDKWRAHLKNPQVENV